MCIYILQCRYPSNFHNGVCHKMVPPKKGLRRNYGFDAKLQGLTDTVNDEMVNLIVLDTFRRFKSLPRKVRRFERSLKNFRLAPIR